MKPFISCSMTSGSLTGSYLETDENEADLETTINGMLECQYPTISVFAFNAAEGWALDVSGDIADEIRRRCDLKGEDHVPANLQSFLERHESRDLRQLTFRLV